MSSPKNRKDTPADLSEHLSDYRKFLITAEQKAQEDFDKTVLSLSGGALGVSFVFLKDVIGANPIHQPLLLFSAWLSWGLSTMAVLSSYYLSHRALRVAIAQVDAGSIYGTSPGGRLAKWTAYLNAAGALLFFVGVCSITAFAFENLSTKGVNSGNSKTTIASSTVSSAASASVVSVGSSANTGSSK